MPKQSATDQVMDVMRAEADAMTPEDMVERLEGHYADSTIRNAMTTLHKMGELRKEGHGVYSLPAGDSSS